MRRVWMMALALGATAVVAAARGFIWVLDELDQVDYGFDEDDVDRAATISTDRGGQHGAQDEEGIRRAAGRSA